MNKDKIIEARNRTYDIYRRFARKINDIDSNVIKVEIHYEMRFLINECNLVIILLSYSWISKGN